MRRLCKTLFCIALLSGAIACGKRQVQIDRDTRIAIDTLVSQQINSLRPALDSLCSLKMDSLVASMRDSVFSARQEEMRKLIGE